MIYNKKYVISNFVYSVAIILSGNWASEAIPSLGGSIEILRDI